MHPRTVVLLSLLLPLGCRPPPSGDQPACTAGPTTSPTAWFLTGEAPWDYAIAADPTVTQSGVPSESLSATAGAPTDFGTLMQQADPTPYLGERVTFRAVVKTSAVAQAGLWMKVVGDVGDRDETTAFYNMDDRPLTGTQDWTALEVTLDVDPDADWISFGVWLDGPGQVWLDQVTLMACGEALDGGSAVDAGLSDAGLVVAK